MPKFKQITEAEWVIAHHEVAAWVPLPWTELEKRLNVKFIDGDVDGLGLSKYVLCKTDTDLQFMIEQLLQAPINKPYTRIILPCRTLPPAADLYWREDLDAVLAATGIKESELEWISDGVKPKA